MPSWRAQPDLFDEPSLPAALRDVPDLMSPAEEDALVAQMKQLKVAPPTAGTSPMTERSA